jgi:hypothetical protein
VGEQVLLWEQPRLVLELVLELVRELVRELGLRALHLLRQWLQDARQLGQLNQLGHQWREVLHQLVKEFQYQLCR